MAKWKPTKAWARKAKKATEELIGYYKKGIKQHDTNSCPFCLRFYNYNLSNYIWKHCSKCPWQVFKKIRCMDYGYGKYSISKRLPRLYGWIRRCDNIIKGGS